MLSRWVGSRHLPPRREALWRRLGRRVAGRLGGHVTVLESRTTERQARHTSMQARPATESYWVLTSYHVPITELWKSEYTVHEYDPIPAHKPSLRSRNALQDRRRSRCCQVPAAPAHPLYGYVGCEPSLSIACECSVSVHSVQSAVHCYSCTVLTRITYHGTTLVHIFFSFHF